ncbi:MAG: hypothetical protein LBB94_03470, partial [Clostridiales bacterium]|nr:hypothetical protein [Clostridiales bacterium]
MANTIQLKRGNKANFGSAALLQGEPAFTLDDGKLYIGDGTNKIVINDAASRFGTCATAAATAAKTVTVDRFALAVGEWLFVIFSNANTAANPTLNINATGAKPIYYKNAAITAASLTANRPFLLVYDGAQFELLGDIDTNTTYSILTTALIQAGTETTGKLVSAKVLGDWLAGLTGTGTNAGNLVLLGADGKINPSLIPHEAITEVFVKTSQADMLAIPTAHPGDVCVRTDILKNYILQATPATTLANWVELAAVNIPVTSVAGKTGAVTLIVSDVGALTGLGTGTNAVIAAADTLIAALAKLQAQVTARAPLASPALKDTPTAPTAAVGTTTTQIAT